MKRFTLILAVVSAMALSAPSLANAAGGHGNGHGYSHGYGGHRSSHGYGHYGGYGGHVYGAYRYNNHGYGHPYYGYGYGRRGVSIVTPHFGFSFGH